MDNIKRTQNVISNLMGIGVREFILCAGARNSSFVSVLEKNPTLKVWSFFEERSAGFFALGRSQETESPVAIITTSGTAAAELLPAIIEAHYTNIPIVAVTADRPKNYRESGAPQTINQVGLFSHYTPETIDIGEEDFFPERIVWDHQSPLHINVCYDEPLQGEVHPGLPAISPSVQEPFSNRFVENIDLTGVKNPLVIISGLKEFEKKIVIESLKNIDLPIYFEATSGLRGYEDFRNNTVFVAEELVGWWIKTNKVSSIIRIGGVPTQRFWRDLEKKFKSLPVCNFTSTGFSGLARKSRTYSLEMLNDPSVKSLRNENKIEIVSKSKSVFSQVEKLLLKYPESELAWVRKLSNLFQKKNVFIGNSLPIRELDLIASYDFCLKVRANRGANGIDGQISTFLGLSKPNEENYAVLGDLTTMYDLAGLWPAQFMKDRGLALFVINNNGGQIFNRIFGTEKYLNSHELSFKPLADFWNWNYRLSSLENIGEKLTGFHLVEVRPDYASSVKINEDIKQIWLNL